MEKYGALVYALIEGTLIQYESSDVRPLQFARSDVPFLSIASVYETIPWVDGSVWFSVVVDGVKWRLPPNDIRRAACSRGLWMAVYIKDKQEAKDYMMMVLNKRLTSKRKTLVMSWLE